MNELENFWCDNKKRKREIWRQQIGTREIIIFLKKEQSTQQQLLYRYLLRGSLLSFYLNIWGTWYGFSSNQF